MSFEVEGKLHKKFETEKKSDKFQAREFVLLVEDGQYPQYVKFQLVQDRCDVIDTFDEGADVKVYFDLRGREWQEKYFTNLNAWRVEALGQGSKPTPTTADFPSAPPSNGDDGTSFDDLPF